MVADVLRGFGLDQERLERMERLIVNETLERTGFKVGKEAIILNSQGEKLTDEDMKLLAATYDQVKAEWKQRREAEKAEYERQRRAELERRKAEYDAGAAPFREARRQKMLKRLEAEKARKEQK
jgi:hypothetical protein